MPNSADLVAEAKRMQAILSRPSIPEAYINTENMALFVDGILGLAEENEHLRGLLRAVCDQPILADHPRVREVLLNDGLDGVGTLEP